MPEVAIQTRDLTKKFGDFTAVNQISFDVRRGEIFGFLGANGAGKTTAIKMLTGLLSPTSGEGSVAGHDIHSESEAIKKKIGYMSQRFSLYDDLTVKENIRFYGGVYGLSRHILRSKYDEILEKVDLKDEIDSRVGSLPLGWKQKLAFSIALLHEPKIVFLDEPTGGVDPITRRQFWEMIYKASEDGVTVFVTTHYMDEAEYCDRVSIMVDGKIEALDSPVELKRSFSAKSIEEVFIELARGAENSDG
ncbi:ABC transporter ATP-binding protein [Rhodohalobacter sulfatireducens]|uniref:ABC transporter ATP-binding protein n=1 Tax=Rhodohalobacter sulfatireducens TaxID=2911366 RepID=A0ABS9KIG3_9BACT|nr:ABC transporter ATP-binding protein [Rhodohalobacter sulfatireducens]MCG2590642.1 ABC transporter ATP-binding protein [Rhodohalobacter sulfatireducens]